MLNLRNSGKDRLTLDQNMVFGDVVEPGQLGSVSLMLEYNLVRNYDNSIKWSQNLEKFEDFQL